MKYRRRDAAKLPTVREISRADDIPLATLAELARLSPYHFSRSFKRPFGMAPHRYHANRRIERAKHLLANRELSITTIGLDVVSARPARSPPHFTG